MRAGRGNQPSINRAMRNSYDRKRIKFTNYLVKELIVACTEVDSNDRVMAACKLTKWV